ncbi:hypothetical protein PIB30_079691 [Stylosanthes scabra]|uniref:Transposase, Ptta/En/Spm, plant n=1 Tax=Stylosanthes scabra TaxID=79078 RepID=A0ABU6ZPV6_9FABA|nr:hypothetical protein [Stylosanthes scabra]
MTTNEDECQSKLEKKLKGDENAEGSKIPMTVDMATKKQEAQTIVERKMANSSKDVEGIINSTMETRNDKKKAHIPAMTLDEFFEEYEQKCNVPKDGEFWVMARKQFKKRIKELLYTPYQSFRDMLKNRPTTISKDHFRKLVRFWNYEVTSAISKKNKENRSKQKCNHRMGPVNFELIRAELRAGKENNEEPSQAEMFVATRTNKKGESLHSSTQEMIDYVKDLKESGHSDYETFDELFGKERHGRVHLYGRGVTKISLQNDKEIEQLKQQHKEEISSVKNSFDKMMDGITSLLKGLF